ncbi:DUF2812 domain-containing protein [Chakrabartyella piscis]|uniref:DUF2812 domain-containing protein n=1 Tax=Chakrabartyella piscis TaxID=2918914 RepID=UPI0029584E00|nr:DUF2812 domain-containing protein [Chakrabartyella piscis]
MKNNTIQIFAYAPYQYKEMEAYLNRNLQEKGLKLRWCKGIFAGFEKTTTKELQYIVDPIATSSLVYCNRYPKARMEEYMENGWYGVGKSKGCYIFSSDDLTAEKPELEPNLQAKIQKTGSTWSFIFSILLVALLGYLFTSPMMMYNILLRDLYLVLSGLLVFICGYTLVNGIITLGYRPPHKKMNIRYVLYTFIVILFYIGAIVLELHNETNTLFYMVLPIVVLLICSTVLIRISQKLRKAEQSNKNLIIAICVIGVILMGTIAISFQKINTSSDAYSSIHQEQLLENLAELPVLLLEDLTEEVLESKQLVKENSSLLGTNFLYAEEADDWYTFTNVTRMQTTWAATPIFTYLYNQCQVDYQGSFETKEYKGLVYYELVENNTILFQKEELVYLVTLPEPIIEEEILPKIMEKLKL